MKALPFTIPKPRRDALILQEDKEVLFYGQFHQHEEIQISYIVSGEGTLIVGDTVNYFKAGDLLVLGGSLPHVFKSDPLKSELSHMLSVFFTKASFGAHFFETEEVQSLRSFFSKTENGIKILSKKEPLIRLFKALFQARKFDRFMLFLQFLRVANQAKYEGLSSFVSEKKYNDNEGKRMHAVFAYTMNHFREEITLDSIAREAAMTKNAFCKYFKKRTNKTYMSFLNELRIEEACKLLRRERELAIADIAEQSGFQNISHFNRKFKLLKGKTPRAFRKEIVL